MQEVRFRLNVYHYYFFFLFTDVEKKNLEILKKIKKKSTAYVNWKKDRQFKIFFSELNLVHSKT